MDKDALGKAEDMLIERMKDATPARVVDAVKALALAKLCVAVAGTLYYLQGLVAQQIAKEAGND